MKTLTLVRHAKSSWKNRNLSDRERPLSERGRRDAPLMGKRIAAAGIRPSLIVSSPALRAWSTAKKMARELGYPKEFLQREDNLYLASLADLLAVVASQDSGFNNLMLVGHNPGLTDFANFLSPGITDNVPTAGVLSVNLETDVWAWHERPDTALVLYDYPKKHR
jgi:phosphohistidine phosphatase